MDLQLSDSVHTTFLKFPTLSSPYKISQAVFVLFNGVANPKTLVGTPYIEFWWKFWVNTMSFLKFFKSIQAGFFILF